MTISVTANAQNRRGAGVFHSSESLTGTTATAAQAVSVTTDVTEFAASTATTGTFSMADGAEGQEKVLVQSGTGTLNKVTPANMGGGWTSVLLSATDQFVAMRFINAAWHVVAHHTVVASATTATGVAANLYAYVT